MVELIFSTEVNTWVPAFPDPSHVDAHWPDGVARVAAALTRLGHAHAPLMLNGAARTAQQAADALGVGLGQIAKSIIFRRKPDGVAVLVIASGDHRVDEGLVQALVCEADVGCASGVPGATSTLGRANAEFVKRATGFSIGGVSPLAHATPPITLIDRELFRFDEVWAAAGHPHAVFRLSPHDLVAWTGAPVADVVVVGASQSGP
jgi:prolyl-tRNA editing enzyme YbaK/EbsC (Cys-tRNA(Pro) deacylase)